MRQTIVTHEDDLGDGVADAHRGTVISLNGRTVEIDLSDANFARLEAFLAEFLANGRIVRSGPVYGGRVNGPGRSTGSAQKRGPRPADVRAWFAEQGRADEINPRGRIPIKAIQEYLAATGADGAV